ncbi:beta-1,4-galactosyltransferase [Salmonella enterica subsp. enterica serovar Choleraesuis]|nr:beta-1,4-galactosyltransferase [Salmonella enterica subsp. enterica serovar Choleraesuis]
MLPVYVVSLTRDIYRREKIASAMNDLDIGFTFSDAIDARDPQNTLRIESCRNTGGHTDIMTNGEIACSLSHQEVYDKIIAEGHEWAIVLEDDVSVDRQFRHFIDNFVPDIADKLSPKNMYLLGGMKGLHSHPTIAVSMFNYLSVGTIKLRRVTRNQKKVRRACCYLIHKTMCKEIQNWTRLKGLHRADSWKEMHYAGVISHFYYSEFISHPIVTRENSNLESERDSQSTQCGERTSFNRTLKYARSLIRLAPFYLMR